MVQLPPLKKAVCRGFYFVDNNFVCAVLEMVEDTEALRQ
jgi:hypothetical protein